MKSRSKMFAAFAGCVLALPGASGLAHAEKAALQILLGQYDTPLDTIEVSVHQAGQRLGVCNYGSATKDFYLTPNVPKVQSKLARCNFLLDTDKPALLLPNTKVQSWYCPPGISHCLDDITVEASSNNRTAVLVFEGGAPLPAAAIPKPPKPVNFQIFLAQRDTPLPGIKAKIMQSGKEMGTCSYNTATKGNFPLIRPADIPTDIAFCNFQLDGNHSALILYEGGKLLNWHCPPGQFANCQTDPTIKAEETHGGAVMVFQGGEPLVDFTLFVKVAPGLGGIGSDNSIVKLYHGFKEYAWCGPASGGAVINNTRVCEYKLPKGSYAVVASSASTKLSQGCSAPIPSGACKTTLAFGLDSKAYASVEVQKK